MVKMRRKLRGFSLAEVLIAFLILSVVSLVLTGVIPATILGMSKATMRAQASIVAQNRLQQLRQVGYGNILASEDPHETYVSGKTTYKLQVMVEPAQTSDGKPMDLEVGKMVVVQVSWIERNSPQKFTDRMVMFRRI